MKNIDIDKALAVSAVTTIVSAYSPLLLPARNFNADGMKSTQLGSLRLHEFAEQDDDF